MISQEKFIELTGIVIDNFEGGYYHPNMKLKMKPADQKKMGDSGETMFGLDKKHGAQLAVYDGWKEFWDLIDNAGASTKWKQYYRGGILEPKLKSLCAKIMYGWFNRLFNKYIDAAGKIAIENDDRLIIHFSYASWNGEGWYKRFAVPLNAAAVIPENTKENIFKAAIELRIKSSNVVIKQQGENMLKVFAKMA